MRTIEHWIDGKATALSSTRTAPVFNPATGARQAEVVLASKQDVDAAVEAAKQAFDGWSQASLSHRVKAVSYTHLTLPTIYSV